MRSLLVTLAGLFIGFGAFSQTPVALTFTFRNAGQTFALDQTIEAVNGVDYSVQATAFYISRVAIVHDGGQVTALDSNEVFYINYTDPGVELGTFNLTAIEEIRFYVGVPEYLNHQDISQYPLDHPLSYHDPSMHWGWSSGYMHFVINALGDNNNDGTPTAGYQLHCLGDHNYYPQAIATTATVHPNNSQEVKLDVHIDEWLRGTNPATTGILHDSEGLNAVVMENPVNYPVFTASAPTAGIFASAPELKLSVAQQYKAASVSWDASVKASHYLLVDTEGRTLSEGNCDANTIGFSDLTSGIHFIRLYSSQNELLGSAKWIVP